MARYLTRHAIDRYHQRIDAAATRDAIQARLDAGDLRSYAPRGVRTNIGKLGADTVGFIVDGDACFPVGPGGGHGNLVAKTAMRRTRRLKADARAWREQRQELAA